MYDSYQVPVEPPPFNVLGAIIGVFVRPVETMRSIAAARPWAVAIAIMLALTVLGALVGMTTPIQPFPNMPPESELSPEMLSMLTMATQRGPLLLISFLSPVFQLLYIGILFLIARMLGGEGSFSALFSTTVFASLPGVLSLPLTLASNLLNITALTLVISLVTFAVNIWSIVLQVIGIREAMHLSTGRAVTTWLIPLGVLLFLGCILGLILVGVIFYAVGATSP